LEFKILNALSVDMDVGSFLCIGIANSIDISSSPYLKNEFG
jgi:hypothetical protein